MGGLIDRVHEAMNTSLMQRFIEGFAVEMLIFSNDCDHKDNTLDDNKKNNTSENGADCLSNNSDRKDNTMDDDDMDNTSENEADCMSNNSDDKDNIVGDENMNYDSENGKQIVCRLIPIVKIIPWVTITDIDAGCTCMSNYSDNKDNTIDDGNKDNTGENGTG